MDSSIAAQKYLNQTESQDFTEDSIFLSSVFLCTELFTLGILNYHTASGYDSGKRFMYGDEKSAREASFIKRYLFA